MIDVKASGPPMLNRALDRFKIAEIFARHGRVHIPAILMPSSAMRIHHCLERETPYILTANSGDGERDVWEGDIAGVEREKLDVLIAAIHASARDGFQFMHETHRLTGDGEPYADPSHYHAAIVRFLNGAEFLDFARAVTAMPRIAFADAQATRYAPGHFLTMHDDNFPERKRLAAYVLSMTPRWRPDWGGILMFPQRDGHIAEGYTPGFNALNLFRVPQPHLVSMVAPFAGASRYSITGWLRAA
jgi:hypothetical protein